MLVLRRLLLLALLWPAFAVLGYAQVFVPLENPLPVDFGRGLGDKVFTNQRVLDSLARALDAQYRGDKAEAEARARAIGMPVRKAGRDGSVMELQRFDARGVPRYLMTYNEDAAITTRTNQIWPGSTFSVPVSGTGRVIGEWDGGRVRNTHQEFGSRVTNNESNAVPLDQHATHVAGTLMAAGVNLAAKGMAYTANLQAWDFNNNLSEISTASGAPLNLKTSNHSYGSPAGWELDDNGDWYWYGDIGVSTTEDYIFGFYDIQAQQTDQILFAAPFHVFVQSAGNHANDAHTGSHFVWNGSAWVTSTAARNNDGPFDCISPQQTAKNMITVGAVNDIVTYTGPASVVATSFSSRGPTDDGRIKPDIVANGDALLSTDKDSNSDYATLSGTSMSSPNAAGTIALLQQLGTTPQGYGTELRAATIKGVVIHTADEAGPGNGPDYTFGWGLLNARRAADFIVNTSGTDTLYEASLANGGSQTFQVTSNGMQPLRVTLVWADPAATPLSPGVDNATTRLVNNLDLRLTRSGTTYLPYVLNPASPTAAATFGDNNRDNVEQVYISTPPAGTYTITVNHKGSLTSGPQAFSLLVSGGSTSSAPSADFVASSTTVCKGTSVTFTNLSTNATTYSWSFTGGTPATSTAVNPTVTYNSAGTYSVTLTATNAFGSDVETKTGYIVVQNTATLPLSEGFESGSFATNQWTVTNPDAPSIGWAVFNGIAGNGGGTRAAWVNHYNYTALGQRDFLVSRALNLTGLTNVTVNFQHAYQKFTSGPSDTLYIIYSEDCGASFFIYGYLAEDGTGTYVTPASIGSGSNFVPTTANDWCTAPTNAPCYNVDLSAILAGEPDAYIGFMTGNAYGNNLFLDNINITGGVNPPIAGFEADRNVVCSGSTVTFTDTSSGLPTTWSWSFPGGTPSSSTAQNPVVTYNTPGLYTVTLTVSGPGGTDAETRTNYINVQGTVGLPFSENFESNSFTTNQWNVLNPDGGITWAINSSVAGNGGTRAAWLNHYNYTVLGELDGLESRSFDFTNWVNTTMTFQHAYQTYPTADSDTLYFLVSTDCGWTYTTVGALWEDGTGNWVTPATIGSTTNFVPTTANDWCTAPTNAPCYQVDLDAYDGIRGVRVMFVSSNAYGNNLFLDNINISALPGVNANFTAAPTSVCAGGTVVFTNSSTGSPTTYSWSFPGGTPATSTAANPTVTYATPGTYDVQLIVSNANDQDTLLRAGYITVNPNPSVTVSGTNPLCNGNTNGSATANVSGGTSPFTYVWSPNVGSSATVSNLAAGTYSVTVTDGNSCQGTGNTTLANPAVLTGSLAITTNINCAGQTATLTVTAAGGTGPKQFSLDGAPFQTSNVFTGVGGGSHSVVVRDANNCTATTNTVTVNSPAALSGTLTVNSQPQCAGGTGSITASGSGGTGALQYSLNGGAYQSSGSFTAPAGTHTVMVRDANNCTATTNSVTLTAPAALTVSAVATQQPSCTTNNGSITATGSGGTGALQYSLNGGAFQSMNVFTGLGAGTYTVTVRDANNCTATSAPVVLTAPGAPSLTAVGTNIACNGGTGSITATGSGGTGALEYSIDGTNFQAGGSFTSVPAGTYTVTVRDGTGCTNTQVVTITEPAALVLSLQSSQNLTCNGNNTGSLVLQATGGTAPYTFGLTGQSNQSAGTFAGLAAGTYAATLTDANGCTQSLPGLVLTEPTALSLSLTPTQASCGAADGAIASVAGGGTAPYSFALQPGGATNSTGSFASLAVGSYDVTLTDANGCSLTGSTLVTDPGNITVIAAGTNPTCPGLTNGSIDVVASGGTAPLSYSLDGVTYQGADEFLALGAGFYTVYVRDANNCVGIDTLSLSDPNPLVFTSVVVTNASTGTSTDGAINATATGGTGSLQYTLNGASPQPLGIYTSLMAGTYVVRATDANGCTRDTVVVVDAVVARPGTLPGGIEYGWYPQPAGSQATLWIGGLPHSGTLTLKVVDAAGKTLLHRAQPVQVQAGQAVQLTVDLSNLSAGVYQYRWTLDHGPAGQGPLLLVR